MSNEFSFNHYVPAWYQKRFLLPGKGKQAYLDLKPEVVVRDGHRFTRNALLHWGPDSCFAEDDLYTTQWGDAKNKDIEKFFFGKIDSEGREAVDYFDDFTHPAADPDSFHSLLTFLSVQKMRTPKGLAWMKAVFRDEPKNISLMRLQRIRNVFCAIWTEAKWQIAEAAGPTKFIISDHPVTVYNRACPPLSQECVGFSDPDIRLVGSHTYFPLSPNRLLIFTNLEWVRNPFQSEKRMRTNPDLFRRAIFNFGDIQTGRKLCEQEVLQINLITKRRAYRYIAAGKREWLYPEKHVEVDHWRKMGDGYLLMPDPRDVYMGGEIMIGYDNGRHDAFNAYGQKPWQQGYEDKERDRVEAAALRRFKSI